MDTGLIGEFFPELAAMRLEQDPTHRHEDVLAHTIAVVNNVAAVRYGNPTTSRRTRRPARALPRRGTGWVGSS